MFRGQEWKDVAGEPDGKSLSALGWELGKLRAVSKHKV